MNKKISIVADDFGITQKVNDVIIDLIIKKKISDTSCIVLTQNFKKNFKNLNDLPVKFGKGIHLTLTDFKSVTSPKSISFNGKLPTFYQLFLKIYKGQVLVDDIVNEINSQLDIFEDFVGSKPNFIDGHHHVHQLPIISNILLKLIKKRYNEDPPFIRNTYESNIKILKRNICLTKTFLLSYYGYFFKKKLINNNFKTNNGFSGIYDFSEVTKYDYLFNKFIKYVDHNHLLMVHPGESDEYLEKIDPVTSTRDKEKNFFLSSRFEELLNKQTLVRKPLHLSFSSNL